MKMMHRKNTNISNHLMKMRWLLFFSLSIIAVSFIPYRARAHPSPNSLVFLDINPEKVAMEIQLPIPELELAFGHNISQDPEKLVENLGPQLREYILAHIHAYTNRGKYWQIEITNMQMNKGAYIGTDISYWELVVYLTAKPPVNENTRKFYLDYDVIMHQVMNHVALVSIRNDWESGRINDTTAQAEIIGWDLGENVIHPLEIVLAKGSQWTGFKKMLRLGMQHIKEGTDHLLFLIVLLLPATLVLKRKNWGEFGGIKYSVARVLKIVTAFTIGHSITLLTGALGVLKLPQQPVEILIAFSIFVSAVHAVYPVFPGKEMYVAAGFGLIHGLAFSTILSNLKLSAGSLALSILGFNLGIELMQLLIIGIIIPWLLLLGKTPAYKWFRYAGALLAAIAAVAWITERNSGTGNVITAIIAKASLYAVWGISGVAIFSLVIYWWYSRKTEAVS